MKLKNVKIPVLGQLFRNGAIYEQAYLGRATHRVCGHIQGMLQGPIWDRVSGKVLSLVWDQLERGDRA